MSRAYKPEQGLDFPLPVIYFLGSLQAALLTKVSIVVCVGVPLPRRFLRERLGNIEED